MQSESNEKDIFKLELSKYENHLNEGTISGELREAFEKRGYDFDIDTKVSETDEEEWKILENDEKSFKIKRFDEFVYVHKEKELRDWIEKKEKEMYEDQNEYGFWFKQNHHDKKARRGFIKDLVEDKTPSFGVMALSAIMADEYIPLTFTPNFDDLLYDSFYLFLEEKPLLYHHDSLAPQLRFTEKTPTIIKLHGDFLFNNVKNIKEETKNLEKNMEDSLKRGLSEYGLVVVGYGGKDESIMKPLKEIAGKHRFCEHGIWWCKYKGSALSYHVKELLEEPNTFLVEIDSSEELFYNIWRELNIDRPNPKKNERAI